jgi:glycosidase
MYHLFHFLIASLAIFHPFYAGAQGIERIEPPFWWTDMHHSEVEIMVYGKGIGTCTVHSDDLMIKGVVKTENPNYLFIKVNTAQKEPGNYEIRLTNLKGKALTFPFELKSRRTGSAERNGFDQSDVVYLLMPDRFANGDLSNDSHASVTEKVNRAHPGGRHGGDLKGMTQHLDYIQALGATVIWPTPLFEDNDSTYSYHTYGQSDLYKIDPRYGTNEDYVQFVSKAHEKGLKVIQDVVPNHWGYHHWMMKDLPTYEWIHQFPGYKQTHYRISAQMDPYRAVEDETLCDDGWFVRSMPDLNQSNPLVLNYLIQNTIFWMEYANLDGLRIDTYPYNDKSAISTYTEAIMSEYPQINLVGEVWLHDQAQVSYWQKNSPIGAIDHYNSHLPSVMDFTLHDALMAAFKENEQGWDKGCVRFYENFVNDFLYDNPNNLLVFMENHDTQRFNELYSDITDYQLALTLISTIRGIPQIYYGSEVGMQGRKEAGDGDIRRDFPGGWPDDATNAFVRSGRNEKEEAYHSFTSKVLNWRKTNEAVHNGKTLQFIPENNVYVYFRMWNEKTVMVILNNNTKNQSLDLRRFQQGIGINSKGKDVLSGKEVDLKINSLDIGAKTSMILELY